MTVPRRSQLNNLKYLTSNAQSCFDAAFKNTRLTEASQFYSSLIQQCLHTRSLLDVGIVQTHMIKSGYINLHIGNKLIDASLKCGSISYARKLFDELPNRHIVMWNSMISSYISHKKSKEGIGLYERMVLDGVYPDEYTFSCVFKAFSNLGLINEGRRAHGCQWFWNEGCPAGVNRVVDKDVVLFTALIVGYSQQGDDGEALEVFGNMINQGIKANEYTFASVLITCGNLEDLTNGKLVHGLVIKSGYEPAVASQTSLLTMYARCGLIDDSLRIFKRFPNPNHACSNLAMIDEGKQIHAMVTKFGLDRDVYAGAALVNMYGKCGSTVMARSVFDALIDIDVVSMNSMIYSYAQNGFGHEALQLFNSMKELGLEPNEVTILSVLLACNNSGLVHKGCQIFATITNNQTIELTRDHYACMVDLLGRSGRLEEAEALVKQVRNPDVVLWRTLLSACKLHGEVEMAERAVNKVLELAPGDEGSHVLLTNVYASTGNWSQVIGIKSTMRDLKLKKNPAMSWVDVDREVHTFMAGDLSHPRSREINETLEKLIEKVKLLGYVPDTRFVLQDLDEELKKRSLYYHSEKLAISFALLMSSNKNTIIRIFKNLRVCGDCHSWIKFVSKVSGREIIARDAKRFHHFKDGLCSCGDYW
ncbi:pentatricopeptide repeat-containing protein [Prunus yedoensis var. nudiflora]|uniref:Pentatricopeptide repeat-containing protein n=1 Tax=Prunus yedoensis var. nudiflora TaxID=2094558 RepID=A0A314Y4Q3_PRUYE|nr:pentatricopeptide repeat-containing protein [Prunus yedoensis var. nudiflora]